MPIVKCPECAKDISDSAFKCPSCGVQLKAPTRTVFGKFVKWIFILFNVMMLIWFFSYAKQVSELTAAHASDAERTGTAIGASLGTGFLLFIWMAGDFVIGIVVLLTRPKV